MYFANPWGLLALFALPIIVVIHLYYRRSPPLLVTGLHLWGESVRQPASGRKRQQLPLSKSLFLELLAALLLSLLLSQPRVDAHNRIMHLVAVVDGSASMSAVGSLKVSFRDQAFANLAQRMNAAPRGSLITVIATGPRPIMLAGPAVTWREALDRLEKWRPSAPNHDFGASLDLAVQLADSTGEVLFLTDHLPSPHDDMASQIEVEAFGEPLPNVAIVAARWSLDPHSLKGRIFMRLANFGPRDVTSVVTGSKPAGSNQESSTVVFNNQISLEANAERSLEIDVEGGLGQLLLDVKTEGDALRLDDTAHLVEPHLRRVKANVALPSEHPALDPVMRALKTLPDVTLTTDDQSVFRITSASEATTNRRDQWWLGIGPLENSNSESKDLIGPFLIDKRQPLLDGVLLNGVVWGGVKPLNREVSPLISAGKQMLFSRIQDTQAPAFLLNIDVTKSNLTESPDWPILLSNLIEQRREHLPGLNRWNYRLSEPITLRLPEDTESKGQLSLVHGEVSWPLARTTPVELPQLGETGVFELKEGKQTIDRFAVNFSDAAESTLSELRTGRLQAHHDGAVSGMSTDGDVTWVIPIGILLILSLALSNWRLVAAPHSRS